MANEKSGRDNRKELNEYERARSRVKSAKTAPLNLSSKGESIAAKIRNKTTPPPPVVSQKALMEVVEQMAEVSAEGLVNAVFAGNDLAVRNGLTPEYEANFELMNQRHMALAQSLQTIAHSILGDPIWREANMASMKPSDVIKFLDIGMKMERAAMQGHMILDQKKGQAAEDNGLLDIAGKVLKNPDLLDSIHNLIQDDEDEE